MTPTISRDRLAVAPCAGHKWCIALCDEKQQPFVVATDDRFDSRAEAQTALDAGHYTLYPEVEALLEPERNAGVHPAMRGCVNGIGVVL